MTENSDVHATTSAWFLANSKRTGAASNAILIVLPLVLALYGCGGADNLPTEMPYVIVATEDASVGGQNRKSYSIVSDQATSLEQRAHTARRAALDLYKQSSADRLWVFLEPDSSLVSQGYALAIAEMSDGSLTRLEAAPSIYSAQDVSVMKNIAQLQGQFANDPTEERRFAAVAETLQITPEAVAEASRVFLKILTDRKAYRDIGDER